MPTLRNAAIALGLMSDMPNSPPPITTNQVPQHTLPDPLKMQDGSPVKTASDWIEKRRPEVLGLFREHVYGHPRDGLEGLKFKVTQNDDTALDGKAIRREVLITFARKEDTPEAHLLIYIPKNTDGPVPAFLVINFDGNHLIHTDPRSPSPNRGCETPGVTACRQPAEGIEPWQHQVDRRWQCRKGLLRQTGRQCAGTNPQPWLCPRNDLLRRHRSGLR